MKQYEYKFEFPRYCGFINNTGQHAALEHLNKEGQDGWQVVKMTDEISEGILVGWRVLFMREKE